MSSSPSLSSSSDRLAPAEWLLDAPAPLDVILGSATVTVAECMRFAVGSLVHLTQAAGADLELRVGGIPFAAGEVVILEDGVSMRLNRILPPSPEDDA